MKLRHTCRREDAFGRKELIAVIAVVVVLAGLGFAFLRKAKKEAMSDACMNNLKQLGMGTLMYTEDNDRKLPYAYIHYSDQKQSSWDSLVLKYVQSSMRTDKSKPPPSSAVVGQLLSCPQDKVPPLPFAEKWGLKRRTYAMPWHSMDRNNWPPASTNTTGVALWWSASGKGNTSLEQVTNRLKGFSLTSIRTELIPDSAHTMLLTEMAKSNNIVNNSSGGRIRYTADHLDTNTIPTAEYHAGKFSYLLLDGHVERLFPEETVGPMGKTGDGWNTHFGIWSIRAGD